VEGLKLTLTRDFKSNPKFAIVTGIVENSIEILNFLKEKNLLLYCLNPDIFITKSDGSREECAGVIAKKYEEMGGKVIYFGKPFLEVYTKVVPLFDGIDKQKLLAVGDGMETDIEGANKAGIKCVLCLAGLPSIEMNAGVSLADFLVKFKSKPDFIIQSL
jgi:ribonucleotide monophosphatase NagD (HAD superfamily)